MSKGAFLGEFEQIVLLALLRLKDRAYGMAVRQEIEKRTGRNAAIGAVYATLDRMERKGLVTSELGEPTLERGGRAKRYFNVTGTGVSALRDSYQALNSMVAGLQPRLKTP
jgi:DNA-binding PadR family transcriptional regulator